MDPSYRGAPALRRELACTGYCPAMILEIRQGDITAQPDIDVIVNAANAQLRSGSGVCGAIMAAGGRQIDDELAQLEGYETQTAVVTGGAVITGAGNLPNRHVVHAVGPIYFDYEPDEAARLLASAHREAVRVAAEAGARSIAFPAISC
jgi:O-acetyl-ADP-ribose deacetylase (regulator of RNase III)